MIFIVISAFSLLSSFLPLFVVRGPNPQTIYINGVTGGIGVTVLLVLIFVLGSYYYIKRFRVMSKVMFTVLVVFLAAQVITLILYYVQLLSVREAGTTVLLGMYFWLSIVGLIIGVIFRNLYVGIERRNAEYIYYDKKNKN
jgi:hypothetical protein